MPPITELPLNFSINWLRVPSLHSIINIVWQKLPFDYAVTVLELKALKFSENQTNIQS